MSSTRITSPEWLVRDSEVSRYIAGFGFVEERDFDEKTAAPYVDQIMDRISEFDEEKLEKLVAKCKGYGFWYGGVCV